MTTTVKVHVNGKYRATVIQDDREPVIVEGNYNGGSGGAVVDDVIAYRGFEK
jgi:hypothetical protein